MQAYSDPKRENDPHALPDVEVFYHKECEGLGMHPEAECAGEGWYYWHCFPGHLADSDPFGPFVTEAEALADAQKGSHDSA